KVRSSPGAAGLATSSAPPPLVPLMPAPPPLASANGDGSPVEELELDDALPAFPLEEDGAHAGDAKAKGGPPWLRGVGRQFQQFATRARPVAQKIGPLTARAARTAKDRAVPLIDYAKRNPKDPKVIAGGAGGLVVIAVLLFLVFRGGSKDAEPSAAEATSAD